MDKLEKLSDYILRPRRERMAHIDLTTPCDCRLTRNGTTQRPRKQDFLTFLRVEDDVPNWRNEGISRNHKCDKDSPRGFCQNPLHYYLGTHSENMKLDMPGQVGSVANTAVYQNPETGVYCRMSSDEAKAVGWKSHLSGKGPYRHPETGERRAMTAEDAEKFGWIGATSRGVKVTTASGVLLTFESLTEAAEMLKLNKGTLSKVCNGKRKRVNGCTAVYTDNSNL